MNVGEQLKFFRKKSKLTQKSLGEMMGVSTRTIQRFESGDVEPNLETLEKIADVLGCELTDLLGFGEDLFNLYGKNNMGKYVDKIIDAVKDGDVNDPLDEFIQSRELKINALPKMIETLTDGGKIKVFDYIEDLDSKYKTNKE